MAMLLKNEFGLTALKVTMRWIKERVVAHVELESNDEGKPRTIKDWSLSAVDLGLPERFAPGWRPTSVLPTGFVTELRDCLIALDVAPSRPLWLHLVKPYGFLGIVRWEEALVPALGRPILRLPDFLETPRENRQVLDIAICCSEPVSERQIHPPDLLQCVAQSILKSSRRPRTSVHVFADAIYHGELLGRFAGDSRVVVHDPNDAARYGEQERSANIPLAARTLRSPWLLWIRDSMRGRSLDAVHFVCHGYLADDRPALALAESPLSNRDRNDARYVGVGELAAFLTQTGAWSAVFTDPPQNYSEAGLRMLADTLAQSRPGPVLYHALRDQWASALDEAYAFLFAPKPSAPPTANGWFAYCQPAIVETQKPLPRRVSSSRAIAMNDPLFGVQSDAVEPSPEWSGAAPLDEVPNWISAAQRHVEEVSLDLQRRRDNEASVGPVSSRRNEAAAETLDALQEIVAQYARVGVTNSTH